jgi:dolichol-phosphate mannosyltransferase
VSIGLTQSVHQAHDVAGADTYAFARAAGAREAVAIVVPCFNETEALPQLFERLADVEAAFGDRAEVHWCFVDDGSTDGTWAALCEHVRRKPNRSALRHDWNRGLAAAIMTGISHSDAPIICSIDADCTYDPMELPAMLERLTDEVAAVTASPYHPAGGVSGVAAWRLWLSKLASAFYRRVSRNKLHTYTSCFRAYRREAVSGIRLRHHRFAGVAEMLWRVERRGGKVVEYPITLHCRKVGQSKLRVLPVMLEHFRLLARCAWERAFRPQHLLDSATFAGNHAMSHHAQSGAEREATPAAAKIAKR